MSSVRRAMLISLTERYLLIVIAFASMAILARLLTPEQIGLYSVSLAVISIAQVLRDFGIGNFLIQQEDLTKEHVQTAFGVSLLLGTALFILIVVAAPWIGRFYGEPRMVGVLYISAFNLLVHPFCTVGMALLRRDMAFGRLFWITLASIIASTATTIMLAWLGFGQNSLAIGAVVTNAITAIGTWMVIPQRSLLPSVSRWREVLRFGGQSTLTNVVTTVAVDANDLVIGKVLGFHPVAILSRAQGMMNLFHRDIMSAVRNVALPAFAAAHRQQRDLDAPHARSIAIVTVVAWPFYGLMALYGLEALHLLVGSQWDEAASLVPVFCLAGALAAVNSLVTALLVAAGRNDLVTKMELLVQPLRLLIITVAAVVWRSPMACAVAYLAFSMLALPVALWFKRKAIASTDGTWLRNLARSFAISCVALLPAIIHIGSKGLGRSTPLPFLEVVAVVLGCIALWVVAVSRTNHPLRQEPAFIKLFGAPRSAGPCKVAEAGK